MSTTRTKNLRLCVFATYESPLDRLPLNLQERLQESV